MCILLNGKIPESYKRRAAMSEYILAVDIGTSNVKCMIALAGYDGTGGSGQRI